MATKRKTDVGDRPKKFHMETKTSTLEKLPEDVINEIYSLLPQFQALRMTSKKVQDVELDFKNAKKKFEDELFPSFLLNGVIQPRYLSVIGHFWMAGKYLNYFVETFITSYIYYFNKKMYRELELLIEIFKKVVLATNFNKWATTNLIGYLHLVEHLYDKTNDSAISSLLPVPKDNYVESIEEFGDNILNFRLLGLLNASDVWLKMVNFLKDSILDVITTDEEALLIYRYLETFKKELMQISISSHVSGKWHKMDNKCTPLTNPQTFVDEIYDDEKTCLITPVYDKVDEKTQRLNLELAFDELLKIAEKDHNVFLINDILTFYKRSSARGSAPLTP